MNVDWLALQTQAIELAARGNFDEAIASGDAAMRACETTLGRDSVDYARCILAIAVAHHYRSINGGPRDDAAAAVRLAGEALAIAERAAVPNDPRVLEFVKWCAEAQLEYGDLAAAEALLAPRIAALGGAERLDAIELRLLGTLATILHRRGDRARRDAVVAKRIAAFEALIVADPDNARDHRFNLASTHNNACFFLIQERSPNAAAHAERALELWQQCHEAGLTIRRVVIDVLVKNAAAAFEDIGSDRIAAFTALAQTLLLERVPDLDLRDRE